MLLLISSVRLDLRLTLCRIPKDGEPDAKSSGTSCFLFVGRILRRSIHTSWDDLRHSHCVARAHRLQEYSGTCKMTSLCGFVNGPWNTDSWLVSTQAFYIQGNAAPQHWPQGFSSPNRTHSCRHTYSLASQELALGPLGWGTGKEDFQRLGGGNVSDTHRSGHRDTC